MKDEFYVVLPSNSSMQYFPENTTTHFVTKLPREVQLHGDWTVALTKIQIPSTFQHLSNDEVERTVNVETADGLDENDTFSDFVDLTGLQLRSEGECFVNPGIYVDVQSLIDELNNLECMKYHLRLDVQRGGFARISRICTSDECPTKLHILTLSEKICKILGLDQRKKKLWQWLRLRYDQG